MVNASHAVYANKFAAEFNGPLARIIFQDQRGKGLGGLERETAEVMMTIENFRQLGEMISGMIAQLEAPAARN